jgi:hypothetical protein
MHLIDIELDKQHMLMTSTELLIAEALELPANAIAYQIGRQLAELFPDRTVLESNDCMFNLSAYANDGHCALAPLPHIHNEFVVEWDGDERTIVSSPRNAWLGVAWGDHALQVLRLTWEEEWSRVAYSWLIAERHEIAEAFFRAVCDWNSEVRDEVLVFEEGGWNKSPELFRAIKGATFENLVLPGVLKHELQCDLASFFEARGLYSEYGVPWKRGVLLAGPPGNGKTHAVKALINALGRPCLYVKSFKSQHSTDQHSIRAVFARARQSAPCLLVLEDLDSLITDENRSFFLNELDGFAENIGIVTIATTNHPDRLDPAIVERPSRFDRTYHFALPGEAERLAYIALWNASLRPPLRLREPVKAELARLTDGFSFAYLKELFLAATMAWVSQAAPGAMDAIMLDQVALLRVQMASVATPIAP